MLSWTSKETTGFVPQVYPFRSFCCRNKGLLVHLSPDNFPTPSTKLRVRHGAYGSSGLRSVGILHDGTALWTWREMNLGVGGICKMIFVKCPRPNVVPRSFKISQNLSKVFAFVSLKKRNTRNKETSWKMIVIHIDPMRTTQNITSTAHMILELLPSYTLVDCNEHIQISLKLRHDSEQIWAIIKKEFTFATFLAAIERMRLQL